MNQQLMQIQAQFAPPQPQVAPEQAAAEQQAAAQPQQ
jgi:hypothetical protein